jgi:hypothetical protein
MRCDICGKHIREGLEVYDYKGEQNSGVALTEFRTKKVLLAFCPDCSGENAVRNACVWIVVLGTIALAVLILILGLIYL